MSRLESLVRTITPDMLRAHYVDGRWCKPVVSAMTLARARKHAQLTQQPFPIPLKDSRRKTLTVTFKGHKHERTATQRAAKIEAAMNEMPKRIEEYYKQMANRRRLDSPVIRLLGAEAVNVSKSKAKGGKAPQQSKSKS